MICTLIFFLIFDSIFSTSVGAFEDLASWLNEIFDQAFDGFVLASVILACAVTSFLWIFKTLAIDKHHPAVRDLAHGFIVVALSGVLVYFVVSVSFVGISPVVGNGTQSPAT
jgi:hypothetical protein